MLLGIAVLANADDEAPQPKVKLSKEESELLKLINAARAEKKAGDLKPNKILCEVAHNHAAAMAKEKKLLAVIEGKPTLDKQTADAGYVATVWAATFGFSGFQGVQTIYDSWSRDDGTRPNLVKPDAVDIGLAVVKDGNKGGSYCVAIFAARMPAAKK
jgi:uncharacterized protein YkwD